MFGFSKRKERVDLEVDKVVFTAKEKIGAVVEFYSGDEVVYEFEDKIYRRGDIITIHLNKKGFKLSGN